MKKLRLNSEQYRRSKQLYKQNRQIFPGNETKNISLYIVKERMIMTRAEKEEEDGKA